MRGGGCGVRVLAARHAAGRARNASQACRRRCWRCGHVRGPSAARTAHERALGWDGAEAYRAVSRARNATIRPWHAGARHGGGAAGANGHVLPAKHEALALYSEARLRSSRMSARLPAHPADEGAGCSQAPTHSLSGGLGEHVRVSRPRSISV